MALSNLNKETISNLFKMINLNDENINKEEMIQSIRSNYSTYSKLDLISKQIKMLQNEACKILNDHKFNLDFANIKCGFKKVPGNYYYVYENEEEKFLSLIAPEEWNSYSGNFISKVYFDYDYNFYLV